MQNYLKNRVLKQLINNQCFWSLHGERGCWLIKLHGLEGQLVDCCENGLLYLRMNGLIWCVGWLCGWFLAMCDGCGGWYRGFPIAAMCEGSEMFRFDGLQVYSVWCEVCGVSGIPTPTMCVRHVCMVDSKVCEGRMMVSDICFVWGIIWGVVSCMGGLGGFQSCYVWGVWQMRG